MRRIQAMNHSRVECGEQSLRRLGLKMQTTASKKPWQKDTFLGARARLSKEQGHIKPRAGLRFSHGTSDVL